MTRHLLLAAVGAAFAAGLFVGQGVSYAQSPGYMSRGTITATPTGLRKAQIRTAVDRARPDFKRCYTKRLKAQPSLHGSIVARFRISKTGLVYIPSATGMRHGVALCVRDTLLTLQFPKTEKSTGVTYRFSFDKSKSHATLRALKSAGLAAIYRSTRMKPKTTARLVRMNSGGGLDKAIFRRYVRRKRGEFANCYDRVAGKATLKRAVRVHLTIGRRGHVLSPRVTSNSTKLATCTRGVVGALRFPRPRYQTRASFRIEFTRSSPASAFGVGSSGFGPGGGGTAWGTIGTGRYGRMGHGGGSGVPRGVSRMRSLRPVTRMGAVTSKGPLDQAIIRRYLRRSRSRFGYCYEQAQRKQPTLQGLLTVRFTIEPNGTVLSTAHRGLGTKVGACVQARLKQLRFPKPRRPRSVQVNFTMTFKPRTQARKNTTNTKSKLRQTP